MIITDKNDFLKRSTHSLGEIYEMISNAPVLDLESLHSRKTALVIVDMINGFVREGALQSLRVEGIIPQITELMKKCEEKGIVKLAFADCHGEESPEFDAYPAHCMRGSTEGEIVEEIQGMGGYTLITKNSTNGFLEEEFRVWLNENEGINTFIVTGDCTDICVQQFAITLKTWFNMNNEKSRIIIPVNAVETYDLGTHNGDLVNVMALYNMIINGVEVVRSVD